MMFKLIFSRQRFSVKIRRIYALMAGPLQINSTCFQFDNEQALAAAKPELLKWQKRLSAAMLKKGVVLKDMRKHLVFTLEAPDS